ncbi:hypothetical protein BPOR_0213g00070 [Botrytis porri]|uniref:Uncharacterized protein n=1 Tax=Botrytis porri TaxID=87229 RepID=A0A4Z1KQ28_9HELO|nr:hypothetical protein BPOR_0213g00070 [Botrytis porri]
MATFCVFAQDDDASPTVIEINYGSTTELMTFAEPTGRATSTSSSANTNTAPSASSTHITRIPSYAYPAAYFCEDTDDMAMFSDPQRNRNETQLIHIVGLQSYRKVNITRRRS